MMKYCLPTTLGRYLRKGLRLTRQSSKMVEN
jgi:hypothetical protein